MKAIVQDEYGSSPEDVLLLADVGEAHGGPTRSSCGWAHEDGRARPLAGGARNV